jgi:hypothetical protein
MILIFFAVPSLAGNSEKEKAASVFFDDEAGQGHLLGGR